MAKNVAVIAVNPVNGAGLFLYLEAFYENSIPHKVYAVSDSADIKTNSGIAIKVDDVIANLKDKVDEYDALVFACGDAVPTLVQNESAKYNQDMMEVVRIFRDKGKLLIGHCAAGMVFDKAGAVAGKKVAVHPLAKPALQGCKGTDNRCEVDDSVFTAQTENTIAELLPEIIKALK